MTEEALTVIRSRRRTLALQVNAEAQLVVRAPERISVRQIQDFVRQNRPWIERQRTLVAERRKQVPPRRFAEGEKFLYLGQEYPLEFVEGAGRRLFFDGERFVLPPAASAEQVRARFTAWYRKHAPAFFGERVKALAEAFGYRFRSLKISSAKRRWASCSTRGDLNFSWRLLLAPVEAIDYVAAHELAHLKHPNHSSRFWAEVERILPDFRGPRLWLKRNQYRFDF